MPAIRIGLPEAKQRFDEGKTLFVDVRQDDSHDASSVKISGSVRVDPNDDNAIAAFMAGLDKTKPVITYCT